MRPWRVTHHSIYSKRKRKISKKNGKSYNLISEKRIISVVRKEFIENIIVKKLRIRTHPSSLARSYTQNLFVYVKIKINDVNNGLKLQTKMPNVPFLGYCSITTLVSGHTIECKKKILPKPKADLERRLF